MYYTIDFDCILPKIRAANKKQALTEITKKIASRIYCDPERLLDELLRREMLSPSACGEGIAIPNAQMSGIKRRFVTLATLSTPIDFQAADDEKVDIICILLSPESDGPIHLRGLSRITRMLKNETLTSKIRETRDAEIIRSVVMNPDGWLLAAA